MSSLARFDRPLDASSSFIHESMNSIWAGVAASRLSASTCLVRGRLLASSMISSIILPVDARLRLVSAAVRDAFVMIRLLSRRGC